MVAHLGSNGKEYFEHRHRCWWPNEGRVPVLVIDEAHSLKPHMLEELRMLINFDIDATQVFSLVLTGHPELAKNLARKTN